jgi:hypothetical protein
MDTRLLLKLIATSVLLASLSGCASLSKSECLSADWQDIGIRDGADGRPEEYLIRHAQACAKVEVTPDREKWLAGREQGLDRFCVPYRAYQLGEYGSGFDVGICRRYDQERLINAYERGLEVNRLGAEVDSLQSEIHDIRAALEKEDLPPKERERMAWRLGRLEYQRNDAQAAYEAARYSARNL